MKILLKTKIIGIAFFNIFIMAVVAMVAIQYNASVSRKSLHASIAGSLSYSATEISKRLGTIESMSGMMLGSSTVQKDLCIIKDSDDYSARSLAYKELNRLLSEYYYDFRDNNIKYMNLKTSSSMVYTNRAWSEKISSDIHDKMHLESEKREGYPTWFTDSYTNNSIFLGRAIRRTENMRLDIIGDLQVCVDLNSMIHSVTPLNSRYGTEHYFVFAGDELIYYSDENLKREAKALLAVPQSDYAILEMNGHNYFAVKAQIPEFDWAYVCVVPYDAIIASLHFSQWLCIIILLCVAFITFLLSRTIVKSLFYHFDTLTAKMKAFGKNENTIPDVGYNYSRRNDELGVIHQQFDSMVTKIQNLIQVNYKNELQKKEAQLMALQSQINPHFLYNTLASIKWHAKASGETEISEMVEALSSLLRAALDDEYSNISIEGEISLVENYLTIQKIRFEERLEYEIHVVPQLLQEEIPKLIVQPLVENAIHYGMEDMDSICCLRIFVIKNEDLIHIIVQNSGSTFPENLLERLQNKEITPNGFGIGIMNIEHRIKLTFGEAYGISLYNTGIWATAKIVIPIRKADDGLC